MTRPHVEPSTRERLTGAVILVALVVLLVPELLSGPRHTAQQVAAPASEPPIRSYTLPLGDESRASVGQRDIADPSSAEQLGGAGPGEVGTSGAATDTSTPRQAATPQAGASVEPERPAAGAKGPPVKGPPIAANVSAGEAEGPAGAVREPIVEKKGPAVAAQSPAATAHAPAHATSTETGEGARSATAVGRRDDERVGPTAHAGAPAHVRPATPARKNAAGWMVQIGSFESRGNADRLAHELKRKGYGAFVSESTSHGRRWYRVRVGPERDRAAAAAVASRLHAAGHKGRVVPPG